ncbi:hypothetical protein [Mesorhizobium sp. WSM2239]|uniref:Phage tail protein n=2 Tax=unclassified Mesorhizobium TaxID=325217 RepID=A0AAU8D7V3_9HYPH
MKNNSVRIIHPRVAAGTASLIGVQIGEHSIDMRAVGNRVDGNQIRLTTDPMVTASRGVFVPFTDGSSSSSVLLGENEFASCTQNYRITEAGVDMTVKYAPRSLNSDNFTRVAAPIVLGARPFLTKTLPGGVLTIDQTLVRIVNATGATLTVSSVAIALASMGVNTPFIVIQNNSSGAANTLTLTHAVGAFWCPGATNYVVPQRGGVICIVDPDPASPTLQILGPIA